MIRQAVAVLVMAIASPAVAQGRAPTPEFLVKANFQEIMARRFVDICDGIAFEHNGYQRHIRATLAQFSDRKINTRNLKNRYAPVPSSRYQRYVDAFATSHNLEADPGQIAMCSAARVEAQSRTMIGQMLKLETE